MNTQPKSFEIFLASFMSESADAARLLESAGLSQADADALRADEEASGFWSPPSLSYFEERLAPTGVDSRFSIAQPVQPGTRRHRFALSLWPDFELGVLTVPNRAPFYPHFVRRPGAQASLPADLRSIRPWSATIEEVLAWFGPTLADDAWDFRRWVTYAMGSERWTITFDFGLVQSLHPADITIRDVTATLTSEDQDNEPGKW